jgi:outer membrane receptor protein involved in Fe transport
VNVIHIFEVMPRYSQRRISRILGETSMISYLASRFALQLASAIALGKTVKTNATSDSPTSRRCPKLLPITCAIATLAWTSPVWSADAESTESASSGGRIEEIVVTARKQAESQQDVPISLTALSDADLHKSTVLSIADLQANAPGLVVSASSKGGAPNLGIRVAHSQNGQEGSGITAYVDDVPMHSTWVVANMMYDMQSVSVLKGPQGTLFGTNSTGGAFIASSIRRCSTCPWEMFCRSGLQGTSCAGTDSSTILARSTGTTK